MRVFVAVMYTLASATIVIRYANDVSQWIFLSNELGSRGVDFPAFIDLRILRGLVYSCGTVGTLVFMFLNSKSNADTAPSAESPEQPS